MLSSMTHGQSAISRQLADITTHQTVTGCVSQCRSTVLACVSQALLVSLNWDLYTHT